MAPSLSIWFQLIDEARFMVPFRSKILQRSLVIVHTHSNWWQLASLRQTAAILMLDVNIVEDAVKSVNFCLRSGCTMLPENIVSFALDVLFMLARREHIVRWCRRRCHQILHRTCIDCCPHGGTRRASYCVSIWRGVADWARGEGLHSAGTRWEVLRAQIRLQLLQKYQHQCYLVLLWQLVELFFFPA